MITFKNKKKNIIVALFLFMSLMIVGVFATFKKNVAKADDYTPYFAMEDGISIKLNEDGGMRFIVKMDTTIGESLINGEKTMQFIIAPTTLFDYADANNMEFINLPKKIVVDVDKNKVYPDNADEPTCYYANGCVTQMNEANFNLDYEAVGYIVGERYTERNSNAAGTYYEKVNATFLNQNFEQQILALDRYDDWYGTDKYPIVVKNSTQYDRLVEKCNAGNSAFSGKYIICENEVVWDSNDFTNEATKPEKSNYCTITYTDADGNEYETFKVAEGAKAPKPAIAPSKIVEEGYKYKFSEWNYNDVAWDFTEQVVNEDVTLTPNFVKTPIQYTITYHTVDGATNSNPTTYTIETPTFEFAKASKDGYYFNGWYTDAGFGTSFSGIETGTTGNIDVYASFIDTSILTNEISNWAGSNIGGALNSDVVFDTFGSYNIYKTNGGYGQSIENKSVDVSKYTELHFAFKASARVNLNSGDYDKNVITPNTWYFVMLEKQADGSWTISVKAFGESEYTTLEGDFGSNATFETMFKTYLWIADAMENNHEVYATDVWGVSVVDSEVATWEEAGAEKLGSALNSSEALTETLGGLAVYKTNGGYGQSIVNQSIDSSIYSKLHFAFKANQQVTLSSGDSNTNVITANTWYFVKLEKQADGSWTISAKKVGDSAYTAFTASTEFFGSNATFETMFRTYLYAGNNTDNHEVYATDVWGVNVVDREIDAWEAAGAEKLGSALNSSEALAETLSDLAVYKTNGGYGQSIVNQSIDSSIYSELHFAFKTNQQVTLSNGTTNAITPNTWYFVKLEKQDDGSWTISAKKVGDSEYTALVSSEEFFGAGNATFETMFRTYLWIADAMENNHEVYATDVWGVNVVDIEVADWEAEDAEKLGSALNSNEALAETLGGLAVYKTNGGYGQSIVNKSIDVSKYTQLYFAFKATQQVTLSNGTGGVNVITPNTWYFVQLEKQADGSWTISVKKVGDSEYTAFTASEEFFGAGNATFETMFRTYLWIADAMKNNHEVYATDVWGVEVKEYLIVEGMIDSLPSTITSADINNVLNAYNAYQVLSAKQQAKMDPTKVAKLNNSYVQVIGLEFNAWEAEGLTNTGFNALANGTSAGTWGELDVSSVVNSGTDFIANTNVDSKLFAKLYFAFKTDKQVCLSSGDQNAITANTWYFVKLEKQADGSWTISAKAFGESEYTAFVASSEFFGSGNATFANMFKTYSWDGIAYNVYATNVWGVSVVDSEIAAWEAAGAEKLGSALNSSEALAEKLGGLTVYKTNGGYGQSIVNKSIDASNYTELYFAFKATQQVNLSNGDYDKNIITPNTWYFVKLEKQTDGSWTISVKAVGDSEYTAFVASEEFFGAGNATFETMFKTHLWIADAMENNHEVYATDVWGLECDCSNVGWDGNTYKCSLCQEIFGTVTENVTQTQEIALYTNATYAGKGAMGNAFDASAARAVTIDFSVVTALEISGITNVAFNGVAYMVSGLEANKVTIDGVVPYDVFGEYTLTAQITVQGATFDIQMPILVITDLITTADGLLSVRKVLRGQDLEITYNTANPVENLVIGGMGGLGTMNGRGYYKLGADIDLANHSIANVSTNTTNSYNRVYVFGTTAVPFAGTFDGAGYVLNNFIAKPNFWNYNVATGFTYLFQDPKGVNGDSHAQEIEASLFGMVDGTIKNLAITNAVFGQNGNVVNGGNGGTLENVYVQINDLQADAHAFVAPIAQHLSGDNMTLTNVVVDLTKHSSAILNGTSSTAISTHYPSVFGSGAVNIENVGVYGFNTAWIDTTAGRGNVYVGNTDGSAIGIYTAGITMSNNANFWQISLDSTIWKIVDGVPMLINVPASGTVTDENSWTGEEGNSYNIAWSDEVAGSYEAVTKIRDVTTQVTTQVLGVTAEDDADIIVGTYDRYAEEAGVDVSALAIDGRVNYGVYYNGDKVYVLADGEEGFRFAADMLLRQLYGYNELADESFTWTDSTISLEDVENETAQIVFSEREPANGYNSGDMSFNATETYTTYGHMHNTLDYLYATDGSGNITGSEIISVTGKNDANQDVTYTTTSYWLSSDCDDVRDADSTAGEQLCYLAHGDKTAFNALVDHVVNRILEIAKARPNMTAINFMIEDDSEYCMCAMCKPFYNPSIPQLLFLNTVAEKLENNEYLKNSCRTIDIVFFAYSSYAYAPITSTTVATSALANAKSALGLSATATETVNFTYAGMNKAGATYTAATDTTSRNVLKAHKNLRLQWTSHKAFHSYALAHEANSTTYLALMAWLVSVDVSKTEVFMYQTTFGDYFLPLNTWKYQVEWYKNLNAMGINGYIFNLGNEGNPADAQTGFAAFKAYIDSRAMTDSSVTYEQLKNEFFGTNGYYGAAGSMMRTFFEELESVMESKKQTSNYLDYANFSYFDYNATNYPYYHYYTDGTSKQAVKTTQADRVQAWYNGAFDLSQTGILFGDIEDSALEVATSVGTNENPSPIHAALTLSPQTNVYTYGEKTQLDTLKTWYQYCVTAKGMVAADSVYAKRIQVEAWFPEYALRLFHSTYTVNFNLVKGDYSYSGATYNYSAECTGVTSALSTDTGLSRSATEFYNELIAGGMIRPSEQSTFDTAEKLSIGWIQKFYRNNGVTVFRNANCICEISASPFVNWGVF